MTFFRTSHVRRFDVLIPLECIKLKGAFERNKKQEDAK